MADWDKTALRATKRLVDIVVGSMLAVLVLPLLVVLAVCAAISLRAWPLFVHERVGRDGRLFKMVKLRTLPPETPSYADKHQISGIRTPAFVRFLRRSHLDELPQLLLVPLGRLSLVGPRPEMPRLHANLPESFATARVAVRPGCTGLWQIGADKHQLIGDAPEWDLLYIRSGSLRLDAWIMWRTLLLLGGLAGLVDLDMVTRRAGRLSQRSGGAEAVDSLTSVVTGDPQVGLAHQA